MEEKMLQLFQWFLDKLDSRVLLFLIIAIPLAAGTLLLVILVGETSRLRAMEYSQRLTRGIWEEERATRDIQWDLQGRKGEEEAGEEVRGERVETARGGEKRGV